MAFREILFPRGIAYGSEFGPGYSTAIARNHGGYELRNRNHSMPLYQGDVIHGVKSEAQWKELLAFVHVVGGMADGFRFEDFQDYTVTSGVDGIVVETEPGSWQMYKSYTFGAFTATRKITKPKAAGITIPGSGTYTYDSTTGIITDSSSPALAPTGWTGEFDTPVRFDIDLIRFQWVAYRKQQLGSIPIIELKL